MRISDWSSDVCSSDLVTLDHSVAAERAKSLLTSAVVSAPGILSKPLPDVRLVAYDASGLIYVVRYWVPSYAQEIDCRDAVLSAIDKALRAQDVPPPQRRQVAILEAGQNGRHHLRTCQKVVRSEEHTSELQSLMRISYAVFFLKNKKNNNN